LAVWRTYSNTSVADTLAVPGGGNLSSVATALYAASGAPVGYPSVATAPWILRLEPGTSNEELVLVTAGAGTSGSPWTVTRGADGTTAKAHNAGTAIQHGLSAGDLQTAATHYAQGQADLPHGLPTGAWNASALSMLDDTQLSNSTTSSFTWNSIPGTSKHLLIVAEGRLTETGVQSDDVAVRFNGDSSAVYSYLTMFAANPGGSMSGPTAGNGFAVTSAPLFRFTAAGGGANVNPGGGFALIPNYAGTAYNKLLYSMSGGGYGTSSFVDLRLRLGCYAPSSQAAITSMSIVAPAGSFFLTGSRFTLYGLG
jgi:hypothetical protein